VAVFGEFFSFLILLKKKGIYDLIFFFQNIFHPMEKFIKKNYHCIQVEELRKIKLETTYPPFNGLLFLLSLAKDVVFKILDPMVPMNVESNVLIFCWKDV